MIKCVFFLGYTTSWVIDNVQLIKYDRFFAIGSDAVQGGCRSACRITCSSPLAIHGGGLANDWRRLWVKSRLVREKNRSWIWVWNRVGAWVLGTRTRSTRVPHFSTRTCTRTQTTGNIRTRTRTQHQSTQYSREYWLSTSSKPCRWYS